jgi:[acyl-carrier-protein] S-malonyltransferase
MAVGLVFPGQGSQEVGMGRAMAEAYPAARAAFDEADRALADAPLAASDGSTPPRSLSALCFEGPLDALTLTANTQPAILATSVACLRALLARVPTLRPAMVAGHSLGEYSALVAAGALSLGETARLVRLRGQAMQDAVPPGTGAMTAVIGMDGAAVAALCDAARAALPGRVVSPANFNAPGQVVVAGHADAVAKLAELVAAQKGRAIPLKVSAPFHCALMEPAAERLARALADVAIGPLACPVVANVDGVPNRAPERVSELLVGQVAGTVRWEQCVTAMVAAGVDVFVEVGPGKVLTGLIKRIHKGATLYNVSDPASLEAVASALG